MSHESMHSCIEACDTCAIECERCASACLRESDVKTLARCIALDFDCAAICRLASSFMARGSEATTEICELCSDICEQCAEECERHNMDHCRVCAQACRQCADECRRMVTMHSTAHSSTAAAHHAS